ncbi:MAG: DUF2877 domain-containing protein [Armatimonadetes bacterium]|nr:DUF2877 domain-containing protein [Armatimonadota bacterium]
MSNSISSIARLRSVSISKPVHAFLQVPRAGTVLSTFTRSCYLDFEGRIVAVVLPDLLNGPLNLVVAAHVGFAFDELPQGASVWSSPGTVHIGGVAEIAIHDTPTWNPELTRWDRPAFSRIRANLRIVGSVLRAEAPEGSFAVYLNDPTALAARPARAMKLLKEGLEGPSADRVAAAAQQLAGLGAGLTPSGDDVLVGTLISLSVLPDDGQHEIRDAIVSAASGRTTRISEAYLAAASRGEAGEAWHTLLHSLKKSNDAEIQSATRRVMAFGETSGADMLTGFVLTARALF